MSLREIEAREQAATKGPWEYAPRDQGGIHGEEAIVRPGVSNAVDRMIVGTLYYDGINLALREPDGRFIAHARTDIPTLIRWVRALLGRADHERWCERNSVVATGDGSDGRGPCTCRLDALREEIGT